MLDSYLEFVAVWDDRSCRCVTVFRVSQSSNHRSMMACASWLRPWNAVFWKNFLVLRRHPVASTAELLAAPLVLGILVAVWSGFSPVNTPTSEFGAAGIAVAPLTILGTRLSMRGQQLAIVGSSARTAPLLDYLLTSYPEFDGSCCFDGSQFPALAETRLASLSTVITTFPSDDVLDNYITASSYGGGGGGGLVWAAIVVNDWPVAGRGLVDVDIRMNGAALRSTWLDEIMFLDAFPSPVFHSV